MNIETKTFYNPTVIRFFYIAYWKTGRLVQPDWESGSLYNLLKTT